MSGSNIFMKTRSCWPSSLWPCRLCGGRGGRALPTAPQLQFLAGPARGGVPSLALPHLARLRYLQWLEGYLVDQKIASNLALEKGIPA